MNPSIATININSPDVSPKNLKSSPSISPRETSSPRRKRRLQKGLSLKKIAVDQNQLTPDGQKTVSGKSLGVPKPQENKFELDESMLGSDVNEDKMGNIDIRIEDIPDVAPITLNLVENPPEQNNTIEEIDQRFSLEPKEELKLELADINGTIGIVYNS